MRYRLLLAIAVGLVAGCAGSHPREADQDAGVDAPHVDVGVDAAFVCEPTVPFVPEHPCSPPIEDLCRSWGQSAAGPGLFGHATCATGRPTCAWQDDCLALPGTGEGVEDCWCDRSRELSCAEGEICVSDTPDGVRRCVAACAWLP